MTSHSKTPFIKVSRGVLQGDCLSPLTFNMCFNTFIQYIKNHRTFSNSDSSSKQILSLVIGFSLRMMLRLYQVISGTEHENQILLNAFTHWCQWSMMIIRVDKCKSFGMAKIGFQCQQYLPKLFLNNELVPQVKLEGSFTYLGRHFNYATDDAEHKLHVQERTNEILQDIDKLPLHPRHKIMLYKSYLLSQISWDLTVANIGLTWVKQFGQCCLVISSLMARNTNKWYIRYLFIVEDKVWPGPYSTFNKTNTMPVSNMSTIENSLNADIRTIYEDTSKETNVQYDTFQSTCNVIKSIRKTKEDRVVQELKSQGLTLSFLLTDIISSIIKLWPIAQSAPPQSIFNFTMRYLNNSLPTGTNMVTWGQSNDSSCSACAETETLLDIVAGCKAYLWETRYDW